jgi:hypothetical protein
MKRVGQPPERRRNDKGENKQGKGEVRKDPRRVIMRLGRRRVDLTCCLEQ